MSTACRQPDPSATQHARRWKRVGWYVVLALIVGTFLFSATPMGHLVWMVFYPARWPMFSRTPTNARAYIVTGPVDITRGIHGVLEIGQTRKQTIAALGRPLVERISPEEAEQLGFWDYPEQGGQELMNGVFAWVDYDSEDRVSQMVFALDWSAGSLGVEQVLLLEDGGQAFLVSRAMTTEQVHKLVTDWWPGRKVRQQGSDLIVEGTGLYLQFDDHDKHLRTVFI